MEGGFETRAITECFGQYGSGKTQIGHLLSVSVQKKDPTAAVVYIDTESTFRPERIVQFAKGMGLDPDQVLRNIKVARAYNSDHQMLLAEKVEELIKNGLNVKLVIVDSLTAHFRAEFVGRGTLADRQQKLNKHMHILAKLADMYNLTVYVTNQVMAKPDTFFGDPTEAIGGNIVGHNSTFRIYLRKGKKGSRVAKLVDAPNIADGECAFFVTEGGLEAAV
jgi:DNA repair protein RadA